MKRSEHEEHKSDPPWRGQVLRAMPGGGWESAEVLVPAKSLGAFVQGPTHQKNTLDVVLGRIENWLNDARKRSGR